MGCALHRFASRLAALAAFACSAVGGASAASFPMPPPGNDVVGELRVLVLREDDTLLDIARHNGLGFNEITAANPGVDAWVPGARVRVVLPTRFILPPGPRRGIVINLAQMRLFYFPEPSGGAARVLTHPIGVGVEYDATPLGETRVIRKAADPTWYPPESIRTARAAEGEILPESIPPGPDNPLGRYAIYLGFPGYLVHGTNRPWGIGMRVSGGCIRMYPEDIESLYPQVPIGTPVRIVEQPFAVGMFKGIPHLQVFGQRDRTKARDYSYRRLVAALAEIAPRGTVDWDRVLRTATDRRALALPVGQRAPQPEEPVGRAKRSQSRPRDTSRN